MNRRDILKTAILAPFVGLIRPTKAVESAKAVAGIDASSEIKWTITDLSPGPDRAVWYGVADCDYPVGWVGLNMSNKWYTTLSLWGIRNVIVNCLQPIKKGQTLVWYPDGTIRGAKMRVVLNQ